MHSGEKYMQFFIFLFLFFTTNIFTMHRKSNPLIRAIDSSKKNILKNLDTHIQNNNSQAVLEMLLDHDPTWLFPKNNVDLEYIYLKASSKAIGKISTIGLDLELKDIEKDISTQINKKLIKKHIETITIANVLNSKYFFNTSTTSIREHKAQLLQLYQAVYQDSYENILQLIQTKVHTFHSIPTGLYSFFLSPPYLYAAIYQRIYIAQRKNHISSVNSHKWEQYQKIAYLISEIMSIHLNNTLR